MEVSVEVDKIIKSVIYNTVFHHSGEGIDDVLVRLLIIKQIMSLPNMFRTISNIYTYPFNPQLVIKTYVENHDKKPKDQRNFYMLTITFKWMDVFQSWLDCFSIGV